MTQSVFCENCLSQTDVTEQVISLLSSTKGGKVELSELELEVSCCDDPSLLWISSKVLPSEGHGITPEEIEKRRERAEEGAEEEEE